MTGWCHKRHTSSLIIALFDGGKEDAELKMWYSRVADSGGNIDCALVRGLPADAPEG